MIVGARQVVLVSETADLLGFVHITISRAYNVAKKINPVSNGYVGKNALLRTEVRGEYFKLTGRQVTEITTRYNSCMQKSISEQTHPILKGWATTKINLGKV